MERASVRESALGWGGRRALTCAPTRQGETEGVRESGRAWGGEKGTEREGGRARGALTCAPTRQRMRTASDSPRPDAKCSGVCPELCGANISVGQQASFDVRVSQGSCAGLSHGAHYRSLLACIPVSRVDIGAELLNELCDGDEA